jgi:hypothetical protein
MDIRVIFSLYIFKLGSGNAIPKCGTWEFEDRAETGKSQLSSPHSFSTKERL